MEYYTRLKNARIDSDLTQTQVAEIIGTKQQQIYKYENGLQSMTIERLKEFCILYKVSADYILGIERRTGKTNQSDCTKYTFLYSYVPKSQATLSGGFFSLQSAPHGALPKNVIETRYRPLRGLGL